MAKKRKRTKLWAHLVSMHATIISPEASREDLEDMHSREHNGPGGIRNHDEKSRDYSLSKLGNVLAESDE